jgi:glutamyl/glutaminyl-tRNA synthetase
MKTRIAPSPTGYFHLGTLRTALLNFLKAKTNNGTFLLRIDDTDQSRNEQKYIDYIYSEMKKYGLDYDETFKQSDRLIRYKEVAEKIAKKVNNTYELEIEDYKMIILRDTGYPTYNFASILDDYDYNVTQIIRGVDHISNLDKQKFIWDKICSIYGAKPFPEVTHAGLLFDGKDKLSKSSNNGTTDDYKFYKPQAILNWLFKFGWSSPDPNFDSKYKILSMDDMKKVFNSGKISSSNCKIDMKKLESLNKKHK